MNKSTDAPPDDAGGRSLYASWKISQAVPDPEALQAVTGNNRARLRQVLKLIVVLVDGKPASRFFLGGRPLGKLFNVPHASAVRWLAQLEAQGFITRTWKGMLCLRDEAGNLYAPGAEGKEPELVARASEFRFNGLGYAK